MSLGPDPPAGPSAPVQVVEPELASGVLPPDPLGASATNLPEQATSFIGREHELAEVERLLGTTRLLTLTGVGGTGKTRLALQAGAAAFASFLDGVYLVELETLVDGPLVVGAALSALGARDYPDLTPTTSLTQYLRAREALVILDNCEHVVGEVAKLAAGILRYCPKVRILATSREPLLTAGEVTFSVPPLQRPDPGHLPVLEELGAFDSVRLFVERALAVDPAFELDDVNATAVAEICARLDGIPMAIELAAARVRGLTPAQIAERLSDRFRLLTGGSRTSLPRQQTLKASFDWSHELLTGPERAAWRRLSIFPAGCSLQGAEAVAGFGDIEPEEVADLVDQLVGRSILYRSGSADDVRYQMLETLRAYGTGRLGEAGEEQEAETCLRSFAVAVAEASFEDWLGRLRSGEGSLTFGAGPVFAAEHATLRALTAEAVARGDHRTARRLGAVLGTYGLATVQHRETATMLRSIVEMPDGGEPEELYLVLCVVVWAFLGVIAWSVLDPEDAAGRRRRLERAVEIARAGDPRSGAGVWLESALEILGLVMWQEGDLAGAAAVLEEAASVVEGPAAAMPFSFLAETEYQLGHRDRALQVLEEAEACAGQSQGSVAAVHVMGARLFFAVAEGDLATAEELLVARRQMADNRWYQSLGDSARCLVYAASDRHLEALDLLLGQDDEAILAYLPRKAVVVELAIAAALPEQAAVVSSFKDRTLSFVVPGVVLLTRVSAVEEHLREVLGEAQWEALRLEGEALRGLDRIQFLREAAREGREALVETATPTRRRGVARDRRGPARSFGASSTRRPAPPLQRDDALSALRSMDRLSLRQLSVVGSYRRYDERVRNELHDWQQRISLPVGQDSDSHQNFLIWAAPGSGKSFLVQETARLLGDAVTYFELNLARLSHEEFSAALAEVRACTAPLICLLDEIDARAEEAWPYEEAFSLLDLNLSPERRVVFVLIGSHRGGMALMAEHIASRPKGADLLDRVPVNQRFEIPGPALEDKAVIVASHVEDAGRLRGEPVEELERLALYYALTDPSLTTPRQLRDLAVAAVQNLPPGEKRLRYDDLFYRGDGRSHQFWTSHRVAAEELSGLYVHLDS